MKATIIETDGFIAAVFQDGKTEYAPCMETLKLTLACKGIEVEPAEWVPDGGKASVKAAVISALSSKDPAAEFERFV